ncbi:MAG: hypothetical protein JW727_03585 [Candidatus Aenigmarchaeota archaeon]|nr:hypothetical protein [Candidatus Aenigmarchaeota archaeon]
MRYGQLGWKQAFEKLDPRTKTYLVDVALERYNSPPFLSPKRQIYQRTSLNSSSNPPEVTRQELSSGTSDYNPAAGRKFDLKGFLGQLEKNGTNLDELNFRHSQIDSGVVYSQGPHCPLPCDPVKQVETCGIKPHRRC